MQCPSCGRAAPDGVKFCGGCGTRLDVPPPPPPPAPPVTQVSCPDCGAAHAPGAKFCRQCGARLGDAVAATEVIPASPLVEAVPPAMPVMEAAPPPVIEAAPPPAPVSEAAPPPVVEVAPPPVPPTESVPPPVIEAAPPPMPMMEAAPPPIVEAAPPPSPYPPVPPAPHFEEQIPADFSAPIPPPIAPEPPAPAPAPVATSAEDLSDRTVLRAPSAVACPTCGATNVANAPQCQQCGQPFITSAPVTTAAPPATPEVDPDATVIMARGTPASAPQPAAPTGFPGGLEPQVMDLSAIETPAPSAPPQRQPTPARRGPSGLLLGLGVAFALLALVAGAGVVTYLKIIKPARQALATATSSAPANPTPPVASTVPPASIDLSASTQAPAPTTTRVVQAPPTATGGAVAAATPQTAAVPPQATDTGASMPQQTQAPAEAPPAPSPVEPQAAPPPTVDPALQLASERTRRGERAYARGDYESAISNARSALNAKPGYSRAQRLIRRAQDAQARVADQQMQQQAEAAARARAAAAAAAPPKPTPDQIYNQRAHDECHRGFFGKSCRHKIRDQVCQGVQPGTAGATVCSKGD